jgi:hypothetical protein
MKETICIQAGVLSNVEVLRKWLVNFRYKLEFDRFNYIILVVSDSKTPDLKSMLYEERVFHEGQPIQFFELRTDKRGFSRIMNLTRDFAIGKNVDYFVISNNDAYVRNNNWSSMMVDSCNSHDAWVVHTSVCQEAKNEVNVEQRLLPSFWWLIPTKHSLVWDECYADSGGAYFDDYDYCQDVYSQDGRIIKDCRVAVDHTSEGEMQTDPMREYKRLLNKKVFTQKWGWMPEDFYGV